jgi:hypothetical protein
MTATLISLISIFMGIIGSNLTGIVFKKYSLGLIGNTITGVFGSILIIKSIGRLGFDPHFIAQHGTVNYGLFALNSLVSFFSGAMAIILISKLKYKLKKAELEKNDIS